MKENKVFWYFLCGIAAICMLFLFINAADARQLSADECNAVAGDVETIANVRDGGAKEVDVLKKIKETLEPLIGQEDSYITTKDDLQYMLTLAHIIFERTSIKPLRFAQMVYGSCMKYGFGHLYEIAREVKVT